MVEKSVEGDFYHYHYYNSKRRRVFIGSDSEVVMAGGRIIYCEALFLATR